MVYVSHLYDIQHADDEMLNGDGLKIDCWSYSLIDTYPFRHPSLRQCTSNAECRVQTGTPVLQQCLRDLQSLLKFLVCNLHLS